MEKQNKIAPTHGCIKRARAFAVVPQQKICKPKGIFATDPQYKRVFCKTVVRSITTLMKVYL